jgi:hypothetical protein
LDFAFCGSRPLRTSWLIVGMKPFTLSYFTGAQNAENRDASRLPGHYDATAMFKLLCPSEADSWTFKRTTTAPGEAAYSGGSPKGQRGKGEADGARPSSRLRSNVRCSSESIHRKVRVTTAVCLSTCRKERAALACQDPGNACGGQDKRLATKPSHDTPRGTFGRTFA